MSDVNITGVVVPAWTAGTQVDTDVSGRILRAWMPAIHAGMTCEGERKIMNAFMVNGIV